MANSPQNDPSVNDASTPLSVIDPVYRYHNHSPMLTRPDYVEKQIVVIHSYELSDCSFANENLIIKRDGQIVNQTSLHRVFCIFLIGE
jgi:hypothetical protein